MDKVTKDNSTHWYHLKTKQIYSCSYTKDKTYKWKLNQNVNLYEGMKNEIGQIENKYKKSYKSTKLNKKIRNRT